MNRLVILFLFFFFRQLSAINPEATPAATTNQITSDQLIQSSLSPHNKFMVDIHSLFSDHSEVTVVLTSCDRLEQLEVTLNSFFHFNTFVIREFIIIEDCNPKIVDEIWQLFPEGARDYPGYFTVLSNSQSLGQIASIDIAYKQVDSKYVYHMEDDWMQLGSYGLIEKMLDVLKDAEDNKGIKVSQVISTLPLWNWAHMPNQLHQTEHFTAYHQLKSYGKQQLVEFSFNPHLINFANIYKKVLAGSLMETIAKRYHCLNSMGKMDDGGCVERYLGKHLSDIGYHQMYLQVDSNTSPYEHIGTRQFEATPLHLDDLFEEQGELSGQISGVDGMEIDKMSKDETLQDAMNVYRAIMLLLGLSICLIFGKCIRMVLAIDRPDTLGGMSRVKTEESEVEVQAGHQPGQANQ